MRRVRFTGSRGDAIAIVLLGLLFGAYWLGELTGSYNLFEVVFGVEEAEAQTVPSWCDRVDAMDCYTGRSAPGWTGPIFGKLDPETTDRPLRSDRNRDRSAQTDARNEVVGSSGDATRPAQRTN